LPQGQPALPWIASWLLLGSVEAVDGFLERLAFDEGIA
jgi:hypothetical protein